MNNELKRISLGTTANHLTINPNKTQDQAIFPFRNKTTSVLNIFLNSSNIAITNSVKYLEVTIDNNLFFDEHIKMLESKVARSVGILSKLKYYVLPKL